MPDSNPSGSVNSSVSGHESQRRSGRRRYNGVHRPSTYAALDLGTNNCRLLVAKSTEDSFRIIDSYSKVVRLGHGLASTGELSQARLAVMGCLNLVDPTKDVALVVDIGGGSTELSWVDIRKFRDPNKSYEIQLSKKGVIRASLVPSKTGRVILLAHQEPLLR